VESLITELLKALFILLTALMAAYLVRHYIFTLTVVKNAKKNRKSFVEIKDADTLYQPKVSILIPARNEESVLGRILQRMTELTYPKDKMQVIVVDDASTDKT
jgi:cellulose synthase/poly-beta-1,6-N-acetylglucosamine synthase-like glycosyltransferase